MGNLMDGILCGFVEDMSGLQSQLEVAKVLMALGPVLAETIQTNQNLLSFERRANEELAKIDSPYFYLVDDDGTLCLAIREVA